MAKPEAPVLETERLILRRRQPRDVPRMLQAYQDEKIRRYLGGYPPKDSASLTQLVRRRTPVEWAITLRGEDLYIGECTINRVVDGYLGELGYLLLREYWGRGYASEAAGPCWITRRTGCGSGGCTRLSTRLMPIPSGWPNVWGLNGSHFCPRPISAAGWRIWCITPANCPEGNGRRCLDVRWLHSECLRIVHGFLCRWIEKPFLNMVY